MSQHLSPVKSKSGDLLSPFDFSFPGPDAPWYSSDEENEEQSQESDSYASSGPFELDHGWDLPCQGSNNSHELFNSVPPNHPRSSVGGLDSISVMSLSRQDILATSVDQLVEELERLNVERFEERKNGSDGDNNPCTSGTNTQPSITQISLSTSAEGALVFGSDDVAGSESAPLRCGEEIAQLSSSFCRNNRLDAAPCGDIAWIANLQLTQGQIGRGSFGRVFKAILDGQVYALKVVEASGRSQLRNIAVEARANMLLQHENVVNCFKCCALSKGFSCSKFELPLELWILQELCEGGTLDEALKKPWLYPPGEDEASRIRILTDMSMQIAEGLEYIHSHGHIHGDLSSNNVLLAVTRMPQSPSRNGLARDGAEGSSDVVDSEMSCISGEEGRVKNARQPVAVDPRGSGHARYPYTLADVTLKISDFGRSKEKGVFSCRTDTIGTVTFMPPETLTTGSLKPSSDIYSLGILLMHIWSGHLPYREYNFAQIIFEVSQGHTPPVPEDMLAPQVIKDLIRQCLSPLASLRPTASEVVKILRGEALPDLTVSEED